METVSEALYRLSRAGYTDEFRADDRGLRSRDDGTVAPAESFRVDEVVRFEGDSDPSDECAIFALTSVTSGRRGTYTVAYGTLMDARDGELVQQLGAPAR